MTRQQDYKLQKLLEMRELERDSSARFLADCRRVLSEAETELEKRKLAVEECRQKQKALQAQLFEARETVKSGKISDQRQYLADLREREENLLLAYKEQEKTVEQASIEVEKALDKLTEAQKELKIIENHHKNWEHQEKAELRRREQKLSDEFNTVKYVRDKTEQTD